MTGAAFEACTAVGPVLDGEFDGVEVVLHWSATLVALVTLKSLVAPEVAEALDPAVALADPPDACALAFGPEEVAVAPWSGVELLELMPELAFMPAELPVTCTSLPIRVRTASRLPVR